ncbi:MAG: hypothetical protein ACHQ6T_12525 [Myxococcota bacterium]
MMRLRAALEPFASPRAFPIALGVGLALRLALLWLLAHVPLVADAKSYHEMGVAIARGESFEPYYPPGLSLLQAPLCALLGAGELVARAEMIGCWLAASFLLRGCTRALAGERAANLAVTCFALYPTSIWLSVEPLTQVPAAACLLAIAWLAPALAERPRLLPSLGLGLATAELALIRPSSLPFLVAVPSYLLLRSAGARSALLVTAIALLPVGAWLARAHAMTGRWVPINDANALNLFYGNNPYTPLYKTWWFGSHAAGEPGVPREFTELAERIAAEPPALRERSYRDEALAHIRARPDLFALRTANRVRAFFALDWSTGGWLRVYGLAPTSAALAVTAVEALFYLSIAAAVILSAVAPPAAGPARARLWEMAGASLLYAAPYFVAFSHPTYHFPVVALGIAAAAAFAERVGSESHGGPLAALRASRPRRVAALLALLALALVQVEWLAMNLDKIG